MLFQDRPWAAPVFLGAFLIFVWGLRLLDVNDTVLPFFPWKDHGHPQNNATDNATGFIRQATEVEFPTPFDARPIREVCGRDSKHFRPGLLFSCEGQHGGIGMLRNQMLKCIRYAIHGGGALVIPSMALRNASDLSDIETSNEVPLDYLMDRKTFVARLSEGCPAMRLYDRAEDFPYYDKRAGEPLHLLGDQFEPNHPKTGLQYPRSWRQSFDALLDQQQVKIRPGRPVHVKMEQSYLEYPILDDGAAFAYEFGKILSFREDTRAMSAKVLWQLRSKLALPIDPAVPINPGAYYGAHLRLEQDAVWAWSPSEWRFSRMKDQFEEQFRHIARTGLKTVYVACGNQTVVDIFADRLAEHRRATGQAGNVTVVTKYDLLEGADKKELDGMTFDQQGLVDFLVMFKASAFMGVAHSAFSWNVALRRHELSRYTGYANDGSDLLRDEYSVIMGMEADYPRVDNFVNAVWP
jgi:hypothetical protein